MIKRSVIWLCSNILDYLNLMSQMQRQHKRSSTASYKKEDNEYLISQTPLLTENDEEEEKDMN